jgi:hypothetical protein
MHLQPGRELSKTQLIEQAIGHQIKWKMRLSKVLIRATYSPNITEKQLITMLLQDFHQEQLNSPQLEAEQMRIQEGEVYLVGQAEEPIHLYLMTRQMELLLRVQTLEELIHQISRRSNQRIKRGNCFQALQQHQDLTIVSHLKQLLKELT